MNVQRSCLFTFVINYFECIIKYIKLLMNKGKLILFCGLPGTGKTTHALKLEKSESLIRLCPDEWIYDLLVDKDDGIEMERVRRIIEPIQWELAKKLLSRGNTVLLENGFWSKEERSMYREGAKAIGADVEIYYFHASLETLKDRLKKRNEIAPIGTFKISMEDIEKWINEFEIPEGDELEMFNNYQIISESEK